MRSEVAEPVPVSRGTRVVLGLLGVVLVFGGVILVTRPFTSVLLALVALSASLVALAAVEVVRAAGSAIGRGWRIAAAVALTVIAVALLAFPTVGTHLFVIAIGVVLLVVGIRGLLLAIAHREERVTRLLWGLASLVFGFLILAWPDVTLLAAGAFFGVWIAIRGAATLISALRIAPRQRVHARARWAEPVLAAVALAVAVVVAFSGARLTGAPVPDDFYAAPSAVPENPGELIRVEPFTRNMPKGAEAWRILYTTTRGDGSDAVSSGLIVVPKGATNSPIIAWSHGTTGVAAGCAPSVLPKPFDAGGMPDLQQALDQGWAVVATDYIGLGADAPHEYLVGESAARGVLDAVRAAQHLDAANLADPVVVWGHSQGGAAALWAGGAAADYAPELDIQGVAAMAPAADLPAMIGKLADEQAGAFVGPFVIEGFAAGYDDVRVEDYVRPGASLLVSEMAGRCWAESDAIVSLLEAGVVGQPIWSRDPATGALGKRLTENVPTDPIDAPLLLAQGEADTLVLPDAQKKYVEGRCAAGQAVDYRTYAGKDHMGVVSQGSPLVGELMQWTEDRFAGKPGTNTCDDLP